MLSPSSLLARRWKRPISPRSLDGTDDRLARGDHANISPPRGRAGHLSLPGPGRLLVPSLALLFLVVGVSVRAGITEVGAIGLVVGDLDREVAFFTGVL